VIDISLQQLHVPVGDWLKGTAWWTYSGHPRSMTLCVGWQSIGFDPPTHNPVAELVVAPVPVVARVAVPFELQLPAEGPASYHGKLIRIQWEVLVRVDLGLLLKEVKALPFFVVPRPLTAFAQP
jgi:hypothetical protein